jgi:DNA repair photolyase
LVNFKVLSEKQLCYDIEGFSPVKINAKFLREQGIDYPILESVDKELIAGTEWFTDLYNHRSLTPVNTYEEVLADADEELEIHNYTGICPTNVLEVSPSVGSCAVGCQYCLVTDGKHVKGINSFMNYADKVASSLERNKDRSLFYYFSPKTEAFSEPHLFNGLAHDILRAFITHYEKHPDSKVRIFIATKAGPQHLEITDKGESLFDLMAKIPTKIQLNGSIGIMPPYLHDILEPNAASISERLESLVRCRELGIWAESVLCQPLYLPYLSRERITEYFSQFANAGVKNIKPEFFTAEVRNIVLVAQFINHFNPELVGEFFYPYLMESNLAHIKQRARLAPDKMTCVRKLEEIRDIAYNHGITISICNWVKRELGAAAEWVKTIDMDSANNGYRCLGYQTNLLTN